MKVWNYLFQGLGFVNSSNMQNELGCLFKVLLNLLQGILLMHDMVWDTALLEQHPVYTYLRPILSTSTMTMSQATKLVILSSVFPQNDNDLMTAGLKKILLPHPLKWFISWGDRVSFLPDIYTRTHRYTKHQDLLIYASEQNCNWT